MLFLHVKYLMGVQQCYRVENKKAPKTGAFFANR